MLLTDYESLETEAKLLSKLTPVGMFILDIL